MVSWQSGDAVANGINIHYSRSGRDDKPALMLLHGATDNGRCWTPVAEALAADFDVLLPDARGHGRSAAPPDGHTSAERAADVAGLIAVLGLATPLAVGGHSMGGQTTFRLAVERPDLVRCAILEDPPFRPQQTTPDARFSETRQRIRAEVAHVQGLAGEDALAYARQSHPNWPAAELPAWVESKQQVSQTFLGALGGAADEPPWTELLPRISCPVLLLTGDPERGAIITPEAAEQARQLNPRVQVVHLAGAGHNIRRERFDGYLSAVRDFLAQHAAAAPLQASR